MSMWKFVVSDLILKPIVSPGCTLICVAKPWIESSPASPSEDSCQFDGGVPALLFSHATALVTGGVQASAREAAGATARTSSVAANARTATSGRASRARNRGAFRGIHKSNGPSGRELAGGKSTRARAEALGAP